MFPISNAKRTIPSVATIMANMFSIIPVLVMSPCAKVLHIEMPLLDIS